MKPYILLFLIITAPLTLRANYVVDFSNPATFQVTCGTIQPSQWSVSASTCELLLPPLVLTTDTFLNINYLFRINQSGNLYKGDYLSVLYKTSLNGAWQTDTTILGIVNNNVRDIRGQFAMHLGDTLYFKIVAHTRLSSGFWAVKSGDISISGVTPVYFPLPVELMDFSGRYNPDENCNNIKWSTASETNNSHFILERSEDGEKFSTINIIPGSGNSNVLLNYEFRDENPAGNYYYRLTQVDYDGKSEIFNPVFVKIKGDSRILIENAWFSGNAVQYEIPTGISSRLNVVLSDLHGRILYQSIVNPAEGNQRNTIPYSGAEGSMLLLVISDEAGNRDMKKLIPL